MYVHNILASDDSLDNEIETLNPKLVSARAPHYIDHCNSTHKSTYMYMYMYNNRIS